MISGPGRAAANRSDGGLDAVNARPRYRASDSIQPSERFAIGDRGLSPMDHTFERREVKVEDPSPSNSANEALTKEVREVLGDDHVEVPEETPHREREARARRSAGTATLANNWLLLIGAAVLVPGGIFTFSSSPRGVPSWPGWL
jgi:hypothetical protein